ncbi:MAG: alanine--glyoxylate aminotransferase family protein [Deltaproteobacteria bacterium]|nr:alanine--glyoxylate aminotransferase family protein [Deltaproteobacteria bacterium]
MFELKPTERLLLGPGPSNPPYRVLRALATPPVGHLDPEFAAIQEETCALLRRTFQTANRLTFPVSGTGSAGMEAALVNLLEPGDTLVVGIAGLFGQRMREVATRAGAQVVAVEAPWGQPVDQDELIAALRRHPQAKACALVHGETSTGVLQPLAQVGAYLRGTPTLFVVDTVTSLGGEEVLVDQWGIDVCYSGTQKCLNVPPGLAPITFSHRALEVIRSRRSKVQSWYLDVTLLETYWGQQRLYHHTAPVNMIYALYEGLRIVHEEGLAERVARHRAAAGHLWRGLAELGFGFLAPEALRLPPLTAALPPTGWDVEGVRKTLLLEYDLEVGGGVGPLAGKLWRIGLMGQNACVQKVAVLLRALADFV